jgi:hypothetical protein
MYSQAKEDVYASLWETYFPSRAAAPVRAATASAATPRRPPAAVDLSTWRPSINCGRGECASPPRELDIRPGVATTATASPPASQDLLRAAAMASRTPSAFESAQDATAAAASTRTTAQTSSSTAATAQAPAPRLTRLDPGTDPGEAAAAEQPGARVRLRYFTARAAVNPQTQGVKRA